MPFIFLLVVCFCLWYKRLFSNVRKFWGTSSSLSGGLKTPCLWAGVGWLEATSLLGDLDRFSHCGRHLSLVSWTSQFCLVLFFQNKCFTLFLEGVNYLVLMFLLWTVNVSFSSVSFHLIPRFLDNTSALSGTWCLQSSAPPVCPFRSAVWWGGWTTCIWKGEVEGRGRHLGVWTLLHRLSELLSALGFNFAFIVHGIWYLPRFLWCSHFHCQLRLQPSQPVCWVCYQMPICFSTSE